MIYYLYIENEVWGNSKEGYEVNNSCLTNICLQFKNENFSDKLLLTKLKKASIIRKGIHQKSINFEGDENTIYIEGSKDLYPVGSLYKIENNEMITFTNMHRQFKPENFEVY